MGGVIPSFNMGTEWCGTHGFQPALNGKCFACQQRDAAQKPCPIVTLHKRALWEADEPKREAARQAWQEVQRQREIQQIANRRTDEKRKEREREMALKQAKERRLLAMGEPVPTPYTQVYGPVTIALDYSDRQFLPVFGDWLDEVLCEA